MVDGCVVIGEPLLVVMLPPLGDELSVGVARYGVVESGAVDVDIDDVEP